MGLSDESIIILVYCLDDMADTVYDKDGAGLLFIMKEYKHRRDSNRLH